MIQIFNVLFCILQACGYKVRVAPVGVYDRDFRTHLFEEVRYRDPEDDEAPLGSKHSRAIRCWMFKFYSNSDMIYFLVVDRKRL